MKKLIKLISFLTIAGFMLTSCEGPMGPAGADGVNGADGAAGVDANATCTLCHNENAVVELKQAQWQTSIHATGGNAAYANRTGCVQCHTSQGFLEYVAEGSDAAISIPTEPMQINCYTCHKIHETGSDDDWALTKAGAQTLIVQVAGANVIWDKGTSNQCVACHQSRAISPSPVAGGTAYSLTNVRIGVHHGPNSNLILGKTAYEIAGTAYPTVNPHSTAKGCVTCHMAKPYGYMAGGHNMGLEYDSHGTAKMLYTGCAECHDVTTAGPTYGTLLFDGKIAAAQAVVTGKLETLQAQLLAAGIYDPVSGLAKKGTFKDDIVIAYINYNMVEEDRSEGIHNPGYIKTLLDNSIASMVSLGY